MADNDDYDCIDDEMDAIESEVLQRKNLHRAATHTLPELMISLALTPDQVARLRRDRTTCMVIEAPSAEWVDPLLRAGKRLGEWKFAHAAIEMPRKTFNGTTASDQAIFAMAAGGRILGVSQNLSYLPKAMTGPADIVLKIAHPDDEILRQAIKMATGRYPRSMPEGISHGLDYSDVCGAIRTGSTAKACVERLMAASKAKSMAVPGLENVPFVEDLVGYGEELEGWAKALISDLNAWRAGTLDFSAIQRTAVLASEPGLGKTTFARSLAKSAGIPFFPTSVSQWFANSPGYLDSIIKQIDELFAAAAAVAPALIFLDECEGIPSRSNADRHSSWWIPVVGHMLLKLDSATSGDSSKLIVIGATNHPEKLDAALVRPGRLSKIIHIEKPDAKALEGIKALHAESAETSPIMAGIQQVAVDRLGSTQARSIPNRLVVISDLLENTPSFSMYKSGPDFDAYRQSKAAAEYGTDLAGAIVEVWLLRRDNNFPSSSVAEFWARWVEDNRGSFGRALQLQGVSP